MTRRQREIWEYLNAYTDSHGYAPTLEEIGAHFGLSSLATVHKHLSNLERKGVIARKWNLSRGDRTDAAPGNGSGPGTAPPGSGRGWGAD